MNKLLLSTLLFICACQAVFSSHKSHQATCNWNSFQKALLIKTDEERAFRAYGAFMAESLGAHSISNEEKQWILEGFFDFHRSATRESYSKDLKTLDTLLSKKTEAAL